MHFTGDSIPCLIEWLICLDIDASMAVRGRTLITHCVVFVVDNFNVVLEEILWIKLIILISFNLRALFKYLWEDRNVLAPHTIKFTTGIRFPHLIRKKLNFRWVHWFVSWKLQNNTKLFEFKNIRLLLYSFTL